MLNALASFLAAQVALAVASEMLEEIAETKRERSLLGVLTVFMAFSVWAAWEMLQVRQSLHLTREME
jgi:uncharacterized membrane protein YjdF